MWAFFWVWGVIRSRKNKLYEEEGEEEVDEVVPEGVEEVELARIKVEQAQRECRLLFRDLRMLRCSDCGTRDVGTVWSPKAEEETLWMISSARSILVSNWTLALFQCYIIWLHDEEHLHITNG